MPKINKAQQDERLLKDLAIMREDYHKLIYYMIENHIYFSKCRVQLKFENTRASMRYALKIIKEQVESCKEWYEESPKHKIVSAKLAKIWRKLYEWYKDLYNFSGHEQVMEDVETAY